MYEQISISEYLETLSGTAQKRKWTTLEPWKGHYQFPEHTTEWTRIECRVYYRSTGIETTEIYEYKDFTFRGVEKWNPQNGNDGRIVAWRYI